MRGDAGPDGRHAHRRLGRDPGAGPARTGRARGRERRTARGRHDPPRAPALVRADAGAARAPPPPVRREAGRAGRRDGDIARLPVSLHLLREGQLPRSLPQAAVAGHPRGAGRPGGGGRDLRLLRRRDLPAGREAAARDRHPAHSVRRADAHRSLVVRAAGSAGAGRVPLDRGGGREHQHRGARPARQAVQAVDGGAGRAVDPRQADGALRPGHADGVQRRRSAGRGRLAPAAHGGRRVGQRAGAAVPVSRLARLHAPVGPPRRAGLGARPRSLSAQLRHVQRRAREASGAAARPGGARGMSAPHHRLSRVLMTADAVGGVWTYSLGLAAGLAQAGVAVELAVMGPPPDDPQRRAAGAIPGLRLHESSLKLEWMEDAAGDVARAGDWLLELEARTRPDLVHLNGYAHAVLPFRAPKLVVAHSCVRSWWRAVHGQDPPPVWDAYTRAVTAGLAAADHVVAPSGAMLAALVDGYGPLPSPASVIPNGLPPAAHEQARKRDVVLAAGRIWDAAKNIATLVAVA